MPRLSCGVQCTRTLLLLLNVFVLLIGSSTLLSGISVQAYGKLPASIAPVHFGQALGDEAQRHISRVLIVIGAAISTLGLFGSLGALCHNQVLLYIYATALSVSILLQFVGIVATFRLHNDVWESYDAGFRNVFERAYRDNQTQVVGLISRLEREFRCCGVDNSVDYARASRPIPASCYPEQRLEGAPFREGCAEAIVIWAWNELPTIIGVLGGLLLIEILGVISSLVLAVALSHSLNADAYSKL